MFLLKLAFRNMFRHWKRTMGTALIIALAVFFYLAADSLLLGSEEIVYDNIIKYESGHLQIVNTEYWQEKNELPLDNLMVPDSKLIEKIKSTVGFSALSPQLKFRARLNNGGSELPVAGVGVNPEKALNVFTLEENLIAGSFFTQGERKVVLGKSLADLMELEIGDYITLLVKTTNKTFNTIEVEVGGLLETTNPNINRNFVYLPLKLAQRSLALDNKVSRIIVKLNDKDQAVSVKNQLLNTYKKDRSNIGVYSWSDLDAAEALKMDQATTKLLLIIILIIGAMGIVNTVILAALERMEELGMMKAMGLKEKEIVWVFMLESTGIGLIGVVIGSLLGIISIWYLINYGVDFSIFMQDINMGDFGFPMITEFHGVWNPDSFITVNIFGILVAAISSVFPAWWAAKKDVVESIYHR